MVWVWIIQDIPGELVQQLGKVGTKRLGESTIHQLLITLMFKNQYGFESNPNYGIMIIIIYHWLHASI